MDKDPIQSVVDAIKGDLRADMRRMVAEGTPLQQEFVDALLLSTVTRCEQIVADTADSAFRARHTDHRMPSLGELFLNRGDISNAIRKKII